MLVRMRRIEVVAPRSNATEALRIVHRAGVVHMATFEAREGMALGIFAGHHDELGVTGAAGVTGADDESSPTALLEEVTGLGALLGPAAADRPRLEAFWALDDERLESAVVELRPVRAQAERLTGERQHVGADLQRLAGYRRLIDGLSGAVGRLPRLRGYAATGIIVGSRHRALIGLISEELEAVTEGRCEVVAADLAGERSAAILLYPARMTTEISGLLGGRDLEEVSLPSDLQGVPFDELGPRMAAEVERLQGRTRELDSELGKLSKSHGPTVAALQLVLGDRTAEAAQLRDAARSDHLVVLSGWVPAKRLDELRESLADGLGESILVIDDGDAAASDHSAPVAVTNGPFSRTFEPLSRFIGVPRYGTIDPTPLMALTFPAFVGLMVGDAGYGLVLLVLLLLFRGRMMRSEKLRMVWPIGLTMAISMIAFGILFGEFFGETGRRVLGIEPLWFDRGHSVVTMLVIALSIGVAQVSLGLGLGVVNATSMGHRREAVGRGALLAGLLLVVVMMAAVAGILPSELAAMGAAALIAAVTIAFLAMGLAGPIEMMGVLANVLSYARLMAIGLAGVMLALVADRIGGLIPIVVFGILVAGILHGLNLVLGVFDASVQGLRLHYVEFFTKFVEPGGTAYAPFTSVLGPSAAASAATEDAG